MRLITWNIRQGGGRRVSRLADELLKQKPDVAVLTEFRDNDAGTALLAMLKKAGLIPVRMAKPINGSTGHAFNVIRTRGVLYAIDNQVGVAIRVGTQEFFNFVKGWTNFDVINPM